MNLIIEGILFGLVLAAMIGPVFFSLIQTSITKGKSAGVWMAAGIALSDGAYIAIALLGINKALGATGDASINRYSALAGAVLMTVFGLGSLLKKGSKPNLAADDVKAYKTSWWWLMLKGLLLNTLNPFTLFFWIGAVVARTSGQAHFWEASLFFGATLVTVFCTDLTKVYLADRLSIYITPRLLTLLNRITGLALIGFSIRLYYFYFSGTSIW